MAQTRVVVSGTWTVGWQSPPASSPSNDAGQFPGRGGGGGIFSSGGTVTITDSTVSKNSILEGVGGGILNRVAMDITNSTISDNVANDAFAAGIANLGTMTIINSTVSRNVIAFFEGAGIRNSGTLTIINSTISLNRWAGSFGAGGAGIQNVGGSVQLENTIVALNTRGQPAGGAPSRLHRDFHVVR